MAIKLFLTILFVLTFNFLFACGSRTGVSDTLYKKPKKSYGIGFIPSRTQKIYGWAIGWLVLGQGKVDSIRIDGIYTNLSPLAALTALIALPYILTKPFDVFKNTSDTSYILKQEIENKINGISLSIFEGSSNFCVNGIQVSGLVIAMYKLKGISMSVGSSEYQSFSGVMLSGLYNYTDKGRGLQIGLVNHSDQLIGIQIGLWNKIGNRAFPFLNFNFKSK
jgi:hypothetical protein